MEKPMKFLKTTLYIALFISAFGLSASDSKDVQPMETEEVALSAMEVDPVEIEADRSQESKWLGAKLRPEPYFMPDGSIKIGSNIGNCGGIKVTPLLRSKLDKDTQELLRQGELWVKARLFSATDTPASDNFTGKMRVPEGGFTTAYDWAGRRPSAHYRIYFYVRSYPKGGQDAVIETPVDAQNIVTFKIMAHNASCALPGFISGTGSYGALQMNKGGILQF